MGRRTQHLDKRGNSMRRSRYLTSRMRSRSATLLLVLCGVAARHAAFQSSNGRWAKRQVARKWMTRTHSSQMKWHTFKNCEGLSRVAFMDGNGVVMLGKVISCEKKEAEAAGGK